MRLFLNPIVLLALAGCSPTVESGEEKAGLKIGDPAPAIDAAKWLNGPEHKGFQDGKVYVVDFWAIWCGPCIEMMPHLADLQAEYKDRGLVILPITTIDNRNPSRAVEAFVKDQEKRLPFSFGICSDEKTDLAYREATGVESLPATYVVDQKGKLAFFGHPLDLDEVIPKVIAGTWKGKEDADAVLAGRNAMLNFLNKAAERPIEAYKELPEFEKKYPGWASRPMFVGRKILLLIQNEQYDEAKKLTEGFMQKLADKKNLDELQNLRTTWTDAQVNPQKKYPDVALKVAELTLKVAGPNDPFALIGMAEAYFMAGNKAKAIEYGEKSAEAVAEPELKKALLERVALYKKD